MFRLTFTFEETPTRRYRYNEGLDPRTVCPRLVEEVLNVSRVPKVFSENVGEGEVQGKELRVVVVKNDVKEYYEA